VNGVGPFEVTLTLSVAVGDEGTIRVRYWSGSVVSQGILDGILIIPEPATVTLLAMGLGIAGAYRRR
jgi:hypothetical protein